MALPNFFTILVFYIYDLPHLLRLYAHQLYIIHLCICYRNLAINLGTQYLTNKQMNIWVEQ